MTNRELLPRAAELEELARGARFTPDQITAACVYIVERDVAFHKPVRDRLRALLDKQDEQERQATLTPSQIDQLLRTLFANRPGLDLSKRPIEPVVFKKNREGDRVVLVEMPDEPEGPTRWALFRWDDGGEPQLMPW